MSLAEFNFGNPLQLLSHMNRGRVSVCMATYNGQPYIVRQLASILSQLNETDEVVISDDGSTDHTIEVVQGMSDPRIRIIRNINRKGPVGNFENAINHSTGQFIFLADQDDVWMPNKVQTVTTLLTTNDLILADCQVVDEVGRVIHESFFRYRGSQPGLVNNFVKNAYVGCCMAFRADLKPLILPFPETIYMHDWWIGLLTELFRKPYFHPVPLIQYVRHGGNASPTGEGSLGWKAKIINRFTLFYNVLGRSVKYKTQQWFQS